MLVTNRRYGSSSIVLLDPRQAVSRALRKMDRTERYELIRDLVFAMPSLGLGESMQIRSTEPDRANRIVRDIGLKSLPSIPSRARTGR